MLFLLSDLRLDENLSRRVQIAKVGTFEHEVYGKFSITLADLQAMKKHFEENVRKLSFESGPVFPIDYSHEDGKKSAGWGHKLFIDKDKNGVYGLFSETEWTPSGAEAIRAKEFKFISPDIKRNYKDAETGKVYNIVLRGAALTNVPFLRDMEAVNLLSEDRQNAYQSLRLSGDKPDFFKLQNGATKMPIDEYKALLGQMSPDDRKAIYEMLAKDFDSEMLAEVSDKLILAETELKTVKAKLAEAEREKEMKLSESEKEIKKLKDDVRSLTETMARQEKEKSFDLMLAEGKVCEAQRKPYMENNMAEFVKNQQVVKLSEEGKGAKGDDNQDVIDQIMKLAEKKMEADKDLDQGEAISLVLSENKDLAAKYEG